MKSLTLFLLSLCIFQSEIKAQIPNSYIVSIGYPIGLNLQTHYGLNLAISRYFETETYGGLEGQISYVYTNADFYYSNPGSLKYVERNHSLSCMGGIRLYLTKRKRKIQFYTNMLLGAYVLERESTDPFHVKDKFPDEIDFGFVIGFFFELRNGLIIGISGDEPGYLTGRIGYDF